MMFLSTSSCHVRRLHVQSFNPLPTGRAQRVFQLVVVICTIWVVGMHMNFRCRERCFARPASEALFVIFSGQAPVRT